MVGARRFQELGLQLGLGLGLGTGWDECLNAFIFSTPAWGPPHDATWPQLRPSSTSRASWLMILPRIIRHCFAIGGPPRHDHVHHLVHAHLGVDHQPHAVAHPLDRDGKLLSPGERYPKPSWNPNPAVAAAACIDPPPSSSSSSDSCVASGLVL